MKSWSLTERPAALVILTYAAYAIALMLVSGVAVGCDKAPTDLSPSALAEAAKSSGSESSSESSSAKNERDDSEAEAKAEQAKKPSKQSESLIVQAFVACERAKEIDRQPNEEGKSKVSGLQGAIDEYKAKRDAAIKADVRIKDSREQVSSAPEGSRNSSNSWWPADKITECDRDVVNLADEQKANETKWATERAEREKEAAQSERRTKALRSKLKGDRAKIWDEEGEPSDYAGNDPSKAPKWVYKINSHSETERCTITYTFSGDSVASGKLSKDRGCKGLGHHRRAH